MDGLEGIAISDYTCTHDRCLAEFILHLWLWWTKNTKIFISTNFLLFTMEWGLSVTVMNGHSMNLSLFMKKIRVGFYKFETQVDERLQYKRKHWMSCLHDITLYLPIFVPQSDPVKPEKQLQVTAFIPSIHVPLFWQDEGVQSSEIHIDVKLVAYSTVLEWGGGYYQV